MKYKTIIFICRKRSSCLYSKLGNERRWKFELLSLKKSEWHFIDKGLHIWIENYYLPMEISRITKFTQCGTIVNVKVTEKHYCRSHLVQGGLKIPCEIKVRMFGIIVNYTLLQRYETLLRELYTKLNNEEAVGTFLSDSVANVMNFSVQSHQKNNRNNKKLTIVRSKDIKQMFTEQGI